MTIYSIAKHCREIERGALKFIGMCDWHELRGAGIAADMELINQTAKSF